MFSSPDTLLLQTNLIHMIPSYFRTLHDYEKFPCILNERTADKKFHSSAPVRVGLAFHLAGFLGNEPARWETVIPSLRSGQALSAAKDCTLPTRDPSLRSG
jgi:hypothetical protein